MDTPDAWPFEDSPNVATITTRSVMDGSSWIARATHDDDDGSWQFIGPEGPIEDQVMVVALRRVLAIDDSVAELADLPLGWSAWRDGPGSPWQRGPQ